jgi:hypothetical protein
MALTITNIVRNNVGNRREHSATLAFDSSYPTGGESLTPANLSLHIIESIAIDPKSGYTFEFDYTNNKVKAYEKDDTPLLIVDEAVTVTTNVGTLAYLPSYITSIVSTAGTTTGNFTAIPTGKTPLTTEVAVTFTSGALTFLSTDAVTAAAVTYFPVRVGTFFTYPTVDEEITAAEAKVDLAARAGVVQYVYDSTDGNVLGYAPPGEAPGSGEAVLDINDSGDTSFDCHADEAGNTWVVTYLPYSGLTNALTFIDDTDVTLSSELYDWTGDGHRRALMVPGYGTNLIGEATATNVALNWGGPGVTMGAGVPEWDPFINKVSTNESTAITTLAISWLAIDPTLFGESGLQEVRSTKDLSGVTSVRVRAVGY